jgi:hypothetical protein
VYFSFQAVFSILEQLVGFSNEAVRFEEEIALAVICVSLDGIIKK